MKRILLVVALLLVLPAPVLSGRLGPQPIAALSARQDKQEETVYVTRTGERFHRTWCRYLRQSKIPMKRKAAIERGYTPCKVCKP